MAYNYFPQTYQTQAYYPSQMQPQQNGASSQLIWVQGEGAAKSYLVAPGSTVALFDNESQTIYIKSADASGMPSMRILDYTFRENPSQDKRGLSESDFATKSDVDFLKGEIESLRAMFKDEKGAKK